MVFRDRCVPLPGERAAMKVAFRVDASITIGTGHVMRSLTVADGLRAAGADIVFICRDHNGNLMSAIEARGYEVLRLPPTVEQEICQHESRRSNLPPHADWLGTTWQRDAEDCTRALDSIYPDWLVVDHYALDADWERALRPRCRKIMVIDDLADRAHDCDMLLDQTLGRTVDDYREHVGGEATVLAGSQYALLKPEFAELRQFSLDRRRTSGVRRLLITMGGIDKDNATGKVIDALKNCALPDSCAVTIVMGGRAPWIEDVRERASHMPWPTEVIVDTSEMAHLMSMSDLAIGAAGATSWERCCLGVPSIVVVVAENQSLIAKRLAEHGCAHVVHSIDEVERLLPDGVDPLVLSATKRTEMVHACSLVTDGKGVPMLVKRMVI
ncbi:UDP-2,4-diacetamido-2,4,6-trideoxy-beta-L-altropyranose hydrolase [Rhizobium altiplani]